MNSQDIFSLIERVAATPGKNDKLAIVTEGMQDADFERVMKLTYNPFTTYGLKELPARDAVTRATANVPFDDDTWALLDALRQRNLTGHAARDAVDQELHRLDADSATLLKRIITKDMRAGFEASTLNKAKKGTIPTFPYMRCSGANDVDLDSWDWSKGVVSQEKADGMFTNANHDDTGFVWATSRQGSPIPLDHLPELRDGMAHALRRGTQTHGELLVWKDGKLLPREQGNGVLNHIIDGGSLEPGQRVTFHAWDQIPLSAVVPKGKYDRPYKVRLANLALNLADAYPDATVRFNAPVQLIDTRIVRSKAEAYAHYRELLMKGKEGTIVSLQEEGWKDGTSKGKVKLKLKVQVELRIVGKIEGTGKNVGRLGAFQMESECGLLKVNVNGRTDAMRQQVWDNWDQWDRTVATIEANSILAPQKAGDPYSLFLPVFIEGRSDKAEADDLTRIQAQFADAASTAGGKVEKEAVAA